MSLHDVDAEEHSRCHPEELAAFIKNMKAAEARAASAAAATTSAAAAVAAAAEKKYEAALQRTRDFEASFAAWLECQDEDPDEAVPCGDWEQAMQSQYLRSLEPYSADLVTWAFAHVKTVSDVERLLRDVVDGKLTEAKLGTWDTRQRFFLHQLGLAYGLVSESVDVGDPYKKRVQSKRPAPGDRDKPTPAIPSVSLVETVERRLEEDGGWWLGVGREGRSYVFNTAGRVRYGAGTKWVTRDVQAGESVGASNAVFGKDPAPLVEKVLEIWVELGSPNPTWSSAEVRDRRPPPSRSRW